MKVLIVLLLILFIGYLFYRNFERKRELLNRINDEFGKKPKNFDEDFDISLVKQYYKSRKESEKLNESIDELTWNDLDMDEVFKRTNYTSTTLGETYLYYKYREVSYDSNEWSTVEGLIDIFMQNNSLRNSIKFNLLKVGKLNNDGFINFI